MATETQIKIANATSRTNGAVGKNAVVPRVVRATIPRECKVLDFGAGKDAAHAQQLNRQGWDVDAWEFGDNRYGWHLDPELADPSYTYNRLGFYDVVYASNVLNVQGDAAMMAETLSQVAVFMKRRGTFIANYPASPRKSDLGMKDVEAMLKDRFVEVVKVCKSQSFQSANVFICRGVKML